MKDLFATKTKRVTKKVLKSMSVFQLIDGVVDTTMGEETFITEECMPYVKELQERLSLDTPMQVVMLSAFINLSDDNDIIMSQIANHFVVRTTRLLAELGTIKDLVQKGLIRCKKNGRMGNDTYCVPKEVIEALAEGKLPTPKVTKNLALDDFLGEVEEILGVVKSDIFGEEPCEDRLYGLLKDNLHLYVAQKVYSYKMSFDDLVLFWAMVFMFVDERDNTITYHDLSDYFRSNILRNLCRELAEGCHMLMREGLVEHACVNGQVVSDAWKLTDYTKQDILQELKLTEARKESRANLMCHEDIVAKQMYYSMKVGKDINRLRSLLQKERMEKVLARLEANGMRKGFTCIFYGAPGTGKTETVKQIAKQTGRDIMLVDVASIRSKWVGDTEKNIKGVFERYNRMAHDNPNAPILVFNEADAILNKRNEGSVTSVDKMENAVQNIILQEMENMEGIMIATTNLTGSLDAAFERRFLFKIEFEKPTAEVRMNIWKSMFPDMDDNMALKLADRYDFSGGQIENIARKCLIANILDDKEGLNIHDIEEDCKSELFNKTKGTGHIGF